MKNFLYEYCDGLYFNLTNDCPNCCEFCIRDRQDGFGSCSDLWLDYEPTAEEVIAELEQMDLSKYKEFVFAGFGEPTCACEAIIKIADYLNEKSEMPIRLNTNGLGNMLYDVPIMPFLMGRIDIISISLNAPNAERYVEICNPVFGLDAYPAIMKFAESAARVLPVTILTVMEGTLTEDEIEECRQIAEKMGAGLVVRNRH